MFAKIIYEDQSSIMKMFIFLVPFFLFSAVNAQFHIDVLAGANNNKISIRDYSGAFYRRIADQTVGFARKSQNVSGFSFFAGIKGEMEITDRISITPELLLENVKFSQNFRQLFGDGSNLIYDSVFGRDNLTFWYVSLPVHFTFYASLKKTKVFVGIGGYTSYGITGSNEFTRNYSSIISVTDSIGQISFSKNDKIKSAAYRCNRIDYGISVIAGFRLRNRFFVEGGFQNGFRSIFTNQFLVFNFQQTDRIDYRFPNKKIQFRLGVGYRIK